MKHEQDQVRDFMLKAGQECPATPTLPSLEVRQLRVRLIAEELLELADAYGLKLEILDDVPGIPAQVIRVIPAGPPAADALCQAYDAILDLQVVTIGAGVAMGLDLDPGWTEVCRSNSTKFTDGHRRADGKWVKGPGYSPPDLQPIIDTLRQPQPKPGQPDHRCACGSPGHAPHEIGTCGCQRSLVAEPKKLNNDFFWQVAEGEISGHELRALWSRALASSRSTPAQPRS